MAELIHTVLSKASNSDAAATGHDGEVLGAEATVILVERYKGGDQDALEEILNRCLPRLRRWAHGRLPRSSRGMLETMDLVQDAVLTALKHLNRIEVRHQGALFAYFAQVIRNRIIDLARQANRRPVQVGIADDLVSHDASPLERAIGREQLDQYDEALQRLSADDQAAIICNIEMGFDYEELAVVLHKDTPDAARMAVRRARTRLTDELTRKHVT